MEEKKYEKYQKRINELVKQIESMPEPQRSRLSKLANETQERHDQMKQTFTKLHEGIGQLRMHLKYVLFDLEATRRENQQLRKILRDKQ